MTKLNKFQSEADTLKHPSRVRTKDVSRPMQVQAGAPFSGQRMNIGWGERALFRHEVGRLSKRMSGIAAKHTAYANAGSTHV